MTPFSDILNYPDKTPVKQVGGFVSEVYPSKIINGKSQQNLILKDASGATMRISAWEHSDLSFYKDKDIIITEGPRGGLSVNVYQGKHALNASRTCNFQVVNIAQVAPAKSIEVPASAVTVTVRNAAEKGLPPPPLAPMVNGQKVGMAINNAVQLIIAEASVGIPVPENVMEAIGFKASNIIRLSHWLEQGNLYPEKTPTAKEAEKKDDEPPF